MEIVKIQSNKFKINIYELRLQVPLTYENSSYFALIPKVLVMGSEKYPSQNIINKTLEEMYASELSIGIEKVGNSEILKFRIQSLSDRFLEEKISDKLVDLLYGIVFNPLIVNDGFDEKIVEQEKKNLFQNIDSENDDKKVYVLKQLTTKVAREENWGINKLGYPEIIKNIDSKTLFEKYKELIELSDKKLYIYGDNTEVDTEKYQKLFSKKCNFKVELREKEEERVFNESQKINQGKLAIGLNVNSEFDYALLVYNTILGGSANSKLFRIVREKESLAYNVNSTYSRSLNLIIIYAGIDFSNYDKCVKLIKEQINNILIGDITEEEINSAKSALISGYQNILENAIAEYEYNVSKKIFEKNIGIEEEIQKINDITIEEVKEIAKKINLDTIYFLKD